MNSPKDKQKKKDLGIFYTPREVVDFIFSILNILKQKEDEEMQRWQSHKPKPHYPSVIDPACGEGIFLKVALESKFTKIPYIFGADIDINAYNNWRTTSLLTEFKHNEKMMRNFFFHQDGLSILKPPNPDYHYRGIKKGDLKQFDAVVGNPPYGGIGIAQISLISQLFWEKKTYKKKRIVQEVPNLFGETKKVEIIEKEEEINIPQIDPKRTKELKRLCKNLLALSIWQRKSEEGNLKDSEREKYKNVRKLINGIEFYGNEVPLPKEIDRLKKFPIEILFVNRFIQLAKSGGWIAIIIPDGILANSQLHYVREFIAQKTKVLAIVSLPRDTFKKVGTGAKTSILFLQKYRESDKIDTNYPVFLASTKKAEKKYFNKISGAFKNFYYEKF